MCLWVLILIFSQHRVGLLFNVLHSDINHDIARFLLISPETFKAFIIIFFTMVTTKQTKRHGIYGKTVVIQMVVKRPKP